MDDEGKPALDISIYQIGAMTADTAGNLYFVQAGQPGVPTVGLRIRRIDTSGIVNTIAGGPVSSPSPDGPPLQTAISPRSLAADTHGNVAFTDTLQSTIATSIGVVREVTAQSTLINLAGATPKPAPDGTPARDAWLLNPTSIAFNRAGDLFIAESGSCLIRKIGANGLLATAAGTGKCGTSLPASPNTTQDLAPPAAIVADNQGRFYMLDTLRQFLPHCGRWQGVAGRLSTHARLRQDSPSMRKAGVYLMSMFNLIRISPDGKQETIVAMPSQPGVPPQGFGPTSLGGIGTDPAGNVYFTGTYLGAPTDYVFRVNDDGTFTPVYGSATNPLHLGGFIPSLAVDSNGNVVAGKYLRECHAEASRSAARTPDTPATAGSPNRRVSTPPPAPSLPPPANSTSWTAAAYASSPARPLPGPASFKPAASSTRSATPAAASLPEN